MSRNKINKNARLNYLEKKITGNRCCFTSNLLNFEN